MQDFFFIIIIYYYYQQCKVTRRNKMKKLFTSFFELLVIIKRYYTRANMKSELKLLKLTNTVAIARIISNSISTRWMASCRWGRCEGQVGVEAAGGGGAGREWSPMRELVETVKLQTFHFHCFHWLVFSKPSPWRCRSPDRWPLCRFRSCNAKETLA